MGKIAEYLRSHLDGEITDASDVREHFSTDAGVFKHVPEVVVYPSNEQDVRKVARFAWQLAEKGRKVSITPRGMGGDWTGGAVGDSIIMAMSAHLNRILEMDSRKGVATIEPGASMGKVSQALLTHGLFLPYTPMAADYASVGGMVASNGAAPRSYKYGSITKNIRSLRVVLSNGEVITTGKITKREFNKRMGRANFEGEIYRGLDSILNEHADTIAEYKGKPESAPLNIFDVRAKDGSVDLTPLFVGSQGTLGIITEVKTVFSAYNPEVELITVGIDGAENLAAFDASLSKFTPSKYKIIPRDVLQLFAALNPMYIGKKFGEELPEYLILLEFDEFSARIRKRVAKKVTKFCQKHTGVVHISDNQKDTHALNKLFRIIPVLLQSEVDQAKAVPVIDSSNIPFASFAQTYADVSAASRQIGARYVCWYDGGTSEFAYFAYLDMRQLGQRQKYSRLVEQLSTIILSQGGAVGTSGGGRVTSIYHKAMCGDVLFGVMEKVKQLFDPYNILNAGVKFNVDPKAISSKTNNNYTHSYRHNSLTSDY